MDNDTLSKLYKIRFYDEQLSKKNSVWQVLAFSNKFTSFLDGKVNNHLKNRTYILLYILSLVLLIPRLNGFDISSGKYLMAEDASIFINQTQSLGVASLWQPYAGYLHTYPRLIAFLANYVDLTVRPIIFFIGWILSYLLLISVVIRKAKVLKINGLSLLFLISLIGLQSNTGECFFNITNAHWFLGTALCLLCLNNDPNSLFTFNLTSPLNLCLLLLLGLTGPFLVILMPILIIKAIFIREIKKNKLMYLALFGCWIIQLLVLFYSHRLSSSEIDLNVWNWLIAFLRMILFGANTFFTMGCALLFWGMLIIILCRPATVKIDEEVKIQTFFILATAILLILSALYAAKQIPMGVTILGDGNRYNWVPNSLIFFAAMLISNNKKIIQFILFALLSIINYQHFHSAAIYQNLQFKSFAHFARYTQVIIPVYPQWEMSDSWSIHTGKVESSLASLEQPRINWANISVFGAEANLSSNELQLISLSQDPQLILNDNIICKNASDLGIELDIWRNEEGWIQVFWTTGSYFNGENSLRIWYSKGRVKAQFALPYTLGGVKLRLDPLEKPGEVKIHQMNLYCLS